MSFGSEANLPFSQDFTTPVRVVRTKETLTERHYCRGKLQADTIPSQWVWIDTLNPQVFPRGSPGNSDRVAGSRRIMAGGISPKTGP